MLHIGKVNPLLKAIPRILPISQDISFSLDVVKHFILSVIWRFFLLLSTACGIALSLGLIGYPTTIQRLATCASCQSELKVSGRVYSQER